MSHLDQMTDYLRAFMAPAGVKVRGRGGRQRATKIIAAAGQKTNMTPLATLRQHLDALEAEGICCPWLDLYRWWRTAVRLVGEGMGDWVRYYRSPDGKAKLVELTPCMPEGTRV